MRGDMRERKVKNCLLQCYGKHAHLLFRAHIQMVRTIGTCEYETREGEKLSGKEEDLVRHTQQLATASKD